MHARAVVLLAQLEHLPSFFFSFSVVVFALLATLGLRQDSVVVAAGNVFFVFFVFLFFIVFSLPDQNILHDLYE